MTFLYPLTVSVIRLSLILGVLGFLPKATIWLAKETLHQQQVGLVSLTKLNKGLFPEKRR